MSTSPAETSLHASPALRAGPVAAGIAILLPHIRRHWWLPVLTLLLLLLSSAAQIGLAWSLKLVIDAVTAHSVRRLAFAIGTMAFIALLLPPSQSAMQMCRSVFGGRLARELRDRVFAHLLRAPAAFHDRRHSGELQSRLADDVSAVESMVANDCVNIIQQPLLALASFAYLLTLNGWLALAVAALGPGLYILDRVWGPNLYRRSRLVRESGAQLSQFAIDALGGIQPIKALRAERAVAGRYRSILSAQYAARVGEWGIGNLSGLVSSWMSFAPFVIIFALGGLWAVEGRFSLGALVASVQLMNNVVSPFGNLAQAWRGIQTGRASLDRIGELLAAPAEEEDAVGPAAAPPSTAAEAMPASAGGRGREAAGGETAGRPVASEGEAPGGAMSENHTTGAWWAAGAPAITLEGVSFAYDPEHPVLSAVSLALPAGGLVALVGPNGAGKSTLAKLLLRLYPPGSGEITWNGRPLGEIPTERLRSQIAYLPQEPFLIDATVADNLRLGAAAATDIQLAQVLERVGLASDPPFLQMEVGERGKRLSGGQRLRLALGRALLTDAPLWLLDEPSAALDAEAAGALRTTLQGLRGTHTVIMISHSPDLVGGADLVVAVGGGTAVVRQPV